MTRTPDNNAPFRSAVTLSNITKTHNKNPLETIIRAKHSL